MTIPIYWAIEISDDFNCKFKFQGLIARALAAPAVSLGNSTTDNGAIGAVNRCRNAANLGQGKPPTRCHNDRALSYPVSDPALRAQEHTTTPGLAHLARSLGLAIRNVEKTWVTGTFCGCPVGRVIFKKTFFLERPFRKDP